MLEKNQNFSKKMIICWGAFREHINDISRSKKQAFEHLASSNIKKFKPLRSGLPQAPRRSFKGQQHQKLFLKRNIASNKFSRYHNVVQCGNRNGKYKPGKVAQQRSAISWSHITSIIKIHPLMDKKLILWKRSSRTSIVNKIVTGRGKQNTFLRDSSVWKYFCTPKLSQEEKPLLKRKFPRCWTKEL